MIIFPDRENTGPRTHLIKICSANDVLILKYVVVFVVVSERAPFSETHYFRNYSGIKNTKSRGMGLRSWKWEWRCCWYHWWPPWNQISNIGMPAQSWYYGRTTKFFTWDAIGKTPLFAYEFSKLSDKYFFTVLWGPLHRKYKNACT